MDGPLAQVPSSIHRSSALAGPRLETRAAATSSTTLSSSNGNLTIHSAANVPQVADMEKPNDDPVPPSKRKRNIWIVVHTFVPA